MQFFAIFLCSLWVELIVLASLKTPEGVLRSTMTTEAQSRLAMMHIHYGTAIGREKPRIPSFGDKENVKYCKIPTQSLNCPTQKGFRKIVFCKLHHEVAKKRVIITFLKLQQVTHRQWVAYLGFRTDVISCRFWTLLKQKKLKKNKAKAWTTSEPWPHCKSASVSHTTPTQILFIVFALVVRILLRFASSNWKMLSYRPYSQMAAVLFLFCYCAN